jgi:hypothetical protein
MGGPAFQILSAFLRKSWLDNRFFEFSLVDLDGLHGLLRFAICFTKH